MSKAKDTGRRFLLYTVLFEGLSPVLMHRASGLFPPVLFLLLVMLIASVALAIILFLRSELRIRPTRKTLLWILGITLFNMTGYVLILMGTRTSSGVSTALLLQSEMVWTLLLSWLVLGESITLRKLTGISIVILGTLAVLWRGDFMLHRGELMIIAATMLYPFGNACAKKALLQIAPIQVLLLRYLFGIAYLLVIAAVLDQYHLPMVWSLEHWLVLGVFSLVVFVVSKICWYEGLKRHDLHISVATVSAVPAVAMAFSFLILGELPVLRQWLGFALTMVGLHLIFGPKAQEVPEEAISA
jgi:drug/metabolite transporter (DMT)-like permease